MPQGSILGPWLYIMFTSDVVNEIPNIIKLFADDSLLMASADNRERCCEKMEPDILRIAKWAKTWKLKLNTTKTLALTVTCTNRDTFPLFMNG